MNCNTIFRNIFSAILVLIMGLMLCPNNTAAFSLKPSQIDIIVHSETNFKINTVFMDIDQNNGYVLAGEMTFYLMDFKARDKNYKTVFINERGGKSYADSVKNSQWKGERVIIKGYKLGSRVIVAESIKKVADRYK
jgi:hypothetical protein